MLVDFLFQPIGAPENDAELPNITEPGFGPEPEPGPEPDRLAETTEQPSATNDESKVNIAHAPSISDTHDAQPAEAVSEANETPEGEAYLAFVPDGLAFEMMALGLSKA
nr:hypothetical protein [Marinicella sp. W31]MDC2880199.1 hypothetical protein [Marinicella sp. W31]